MSELTKQNFSEGMKNIQMAWREKLTGEELALYYNTLNEHGISDRDFNAAIGKLIALTWSKLPTLGVILHFCKTARAERTEKERGMKRKQELKELEATLTEEQLTKNRAIIQEFRKKIRGV